MRVLAVTSWGGACGIANYAQMLQEALSEVAPEIELVPSAEALDPDRARNQLDYAAPSYDVVWLNYHRGLHSRWAPETVASAKGYGHRVVITFHDTYGESAPDPLALALHDLSDAFIVHEPCAGLPRQILIRQGVPAWSGEWQYDLSVSGPFNGRPILGTCGFNFPWKNFKKLAEVTAEAGWGYVVLSNNTSTRDEAEWKSLNPYTEVVSGFQPTATIVDRLAGCDATAFPYECANSGTSGAIRLGLAARKPVLAFPCRQMRDLYLTDPRGNIWWCEGWESFALKLQGIPIQRCDPGIVALATRDSWTRQAQKYAEVFRSVVRV